MAPISPTVAALALGLLIKQRRKGAGLSGAKAAKKLGIAAAYLSDLEHGKKTIAESRLEVLIKEYGYGRIDADELRQLREQATYARWWSEYGSMLKPELLRYFGFEHGAQRIDAYDAGLVNGLLQTEEYARAIIRAGGSNMKHAEVEPRVKCRMTRQNRVLDHEDPLQLVTVMGEAAIRQEVGGTAVLTAQMAYLANLIEEYPDSLEIRVLPYEATGHQAMSASVFHLMTFDVGHVPALLWQESVTTNQLIFDAITVNEHHYALVEMSEVALGREDSLRLIQKAAG